MKRRRHALEQIVRKLREADRLLGEGQELPAFGGELLDDRVRRAGPLEAAEFNDGTGSLFALIPNVPGGSGNDVTGVIVRNSIFYEPADSPISEGGPGNARPPDILMNSLISGPGWAGTNGNITGDPHFVNETAGDYHLAAGSPAIDAGATIGAPSDDFDGALRDSRSDIGAFEFRAAPRPLLTVTVEQLGGSGAVTSNPAGITCGSTCSAHFDRGATVELAAAPETGSRFVGWYGACSGTAQCTVELDTMKSVTARFGPPVGSGGGRSGGGGSGGGGSGGGGSGAAVREPIASTPGTVGTVGRLLKLKFACTGTIGQRCHGQASASAIERLSADGKRIIGVRARKPRTGRYRVVIVAKGNLSAPAGASHDVSISLNSTGKTLRSRFKNLPAEVKVTTTLAGRTTMIRTAEVIFGPDPPKLRLARSPNAKGAAAILSLRCRGLAKQLCKGTAMISTFAKLNADGGTITALAYAPSGKGKPVTIATASYAVKAGKTINLIVKLNVTGKTLLSRFGRIPATLKLTPTYNGYTLAATTSKITFNR
jgi:hypothetical protein